MFKIGQQYSKKDIYQLLNVPTEQQKGNWDTGYREYENNIYLFSNVGVPGRTGDDYNNSWMGDDFSWEAKSNSKLSQPLIQKMIKPGLIDNIYLFTRTDNKDGFTYQGTVKAKEVEDKVPVKILWQVYK
jgi:hypothetical protein